MLSAFVQSVICLGGEIPPLVETATFSEDQNRGVFAGLNSVGEIDMTLP
jgi:hypothetical protein